jgi:hypothetical protein
LEEKQWNVPLIAQFNEMGPLQGRLGEQDTIITNDPNWNPIDVGKA